jgi:hypothetical protein
MLVTAVGGRSLPGLAPFPFKIRVSPDVISQDVLLGETLLLDLGTLVYFGLNELGTAVWRELQSSTDANEIFQRLLTSTGLPPASLEAKFEGIITGLEANRIIALEPCPADRERGTE